MTQYTPNRNYPYPEESEPPDGPVQIEALAAAVDSDLQSVLAGEWVVLTNGDGVTGTAFGRLNGDKVELFGRMSKDGGFVQNDTIVTLPVELRPTSTQDGVFATSTGGVETIGLVRCDIVSSGGINVVSQPGTIDVSGTATATGTGGPYTWISVSGSFYKTSPTV
ncbi:hypothetical protein [Streptomyces sp. NBC_00470]|uniref:hypothetical protein n=1 Tax=Streptomyces sp. NBC_00470 TaxID=2975753 RepID=UPI0030E36955